MTQARRRRNRAPSLGIQRSSPSEVAARMFGRVAHLSTSTAKSTPQATTRTQHTPRATNPLGPHSRRQPDALVRGGVSFR